VISTDFSTASATPARACSAVFPRRKRQRDERSLVLAADAEAVARPRDAAGKRHRHNLADFAILVRRHSRLLFLSRQPQGHIAEALAEAVQGAQPVDHVRLKPDQPFAALVGCAANF
jgi:hypothetical protein